MSAEKSPWIKGLNADGGTMVNFILNDGKTYWRTFSTDCPSAIKGGWFELTYDELSGYVEVVSG
jgi:hypothetical protein